ncbi:Arc family DNA-binding protein [Pseudomonadota bacterium]
MPALTIKNIPDDLYARLKESARVHRRSLNSEILYCVERTLIPYKIDVSEHVLTARRIREKTVDYELTDALLDAAKNDGRP